MPSPAAYCLKEAEGALPPQDTQDHRGDMQSGDQPTQSQLPQDRLRARVPPLLCG